LFVKTGTVFNAVALNISVRRAKARFHRQGIQGRRFTGVPQAIGRVVGQKILVKCPG
jgi:hypothetical protein